MNRLIFSLYVEVPDNQFVDNVETNLNTKKQMNKNVPIDLRVDKKVAYELMTTAYDHGVNFFDNAEAYVHGEAEIMMGQVLKKAGWGRDTFIVSSKVFWGGDKPTQHGLSKKHIHDACHAALKRLQVDYLDLYFCHRPDPETPIEETVRAMHTLIMQGKICYWGTSEWSAKDIEEAYRLSRELRLTPPTMEQPEYNMFNRKKLEKEYLDLFKKEKLGTTIWSPLSSGFLTGKYLQGEPKGARTSLKNYKFIKDRFQSEDFKGNYEKVERLKKLASDAGLPLPNMAIGWCLKNENVSTVILGASNLDQLKQNLDTYKYLDIIDDSLMEKIDEILMNRP